MRDVVRDYIFGIVMGLIVSSALWLGFYHITKPEPKVSIVKINTKEITKAITKDIITKGLSGKEESRYTNNYIKSLHSALSEYAAANNVTVLDSRYVFCGGEDITDEVVSQMGGSDDSDKQ